MLTHTISRLRRFNVVLILLSLSNFACEEPPLSSSDRPDMAIADAEVITEVSPDMAGDSSAVNSMSSPPYPLDEELRLNHVQALGTHNSYHLASPINVLPWRYDHLPLDRQLEEQGVRQFELDIYDKEGELQIYHVVQLDPNTTCETLSECLTVMRSWSAQHPNHQPLMVLLEIKLLNRSPSEMIEALESTLRETWGAEHLLTPDLVQRTYPTLRAGLQAEGWPTLGETRGRLLAVLHTGGELREALVGDSGDLGEHLLFPDAYGDLEAPFAAYHSMNDPVSRFDEIQRVVSAGHLVRTRSDVDGEQTVDLDYTRATSALASGAHWISTDYPTPPTEDTYGFVIPEGAPARCNPLTAPMECEPQDIE